MSFLSLPIFAAPPPSALPADLGPLTDSFGRVHTNLRISVTDRCNFRCTYCMPEDVTFMDRSELLTFEEIARFVRVAATQGIDKVRLTGGEPLLRRDLPTLVRMLAAVPGITDLGLTTNGMLLAAQAKPLFDAGLRRINVSLDSLDRVRFHEVTRRDALEPVLEGIRAARAVGFSPVKLNAVIVRGVNDVDVVPLAHFAREHGCELRFIEYMPIGADPWERNKVYFGHEVLETLESAVAPLVPVEGHDPSAPATEFRYTDGGTVGFISSVSRPFCRSCNRLRLTADGKLRNCLFAIDEIDVKGLLRTGAGDERIIEMIRASVRSKWEGHEINTSRFVKPARTMHAIGG